MTPQAFARRPSVVNSSKPLSPACMVLITTQREPRTAGSLSITDSSSDGGAAASAGRASTGCPCGLW
jgi:hypothetical protein